MSMPFQALEPAPLRPIAGAQHTIIIVAVFLVLAAAGGWAQRSAGSSASGVVHVPKVLYVYASVLLAQWALVFFIWRGTRAGGGTTLRSLIGGRWGSTGDVARDLLLAAAVWGAWWLVSSGWDRLLGAGHAASISGLLPRTALERIAWVLVSVTAGFSEELVFRGYLQRQFSAWTGRPWIAWMMQGALFGIAHGYQGLLACMKIALFGLTYGALALWRRSLRPGMIGHAATDILAGLWGI
jgi:CAAX protease family protein